MNIRTTASNYKFAVSINEGMKHIEKFKILTSITIYIYFFLSELNKGRQSKHLLSTRKLILFIFLRMLIVLHFKAISKPRKC